MRNVDHTDLLILRELQRDATLAYADLAKVVGMSAASVHERVRKLRERGVIRRTTVDIDPSTVGRDVLAFVTLSADAWVGDASTGAALGLIPEVEGAYVVAGSASLLVKIRTATNEQLQQVLRRLHSLDGVTSTQSTIVLETFFERPLGLANEDEATPSAG
jgi:Lrp/AsnC family transcriptional regulator, leucine-responsive regulatory protein